MPLTVCRCCGGQMEPHESRGNPNICASCERLLEDESPVLMAEAGSIKAGDDAAAEVDVPESGPDADPQRRRQASPTPTKTEK